MENENLESLLIDYLDGTLTDEARVQVEERLAVDEAARTRYHQLKEVITAMRQSPDIDSPLSLRGKFEADLQSEMAQQDGPRIMRHSWALRIAAGVVLVLAGWSLGVWVTNTRQQNAELAALKAEMAANKKLMLAMLHNQESASTRVMGATVAYELAHSDDDIVQVLVQTLNADPNTNVRLAALEALEKFYQESHVRQAVSYTHLTLPTIYSV